MANYFGAIAFLVILIGFVIWVYALLYRNRDNLLQRDIKQKYGAIYEYLRGDIPGNGLEKYVVFYYLRR